MLSRGGESKVIIECLAEHMMGSIMKKNLEREREKGSKFKVCEENYSNIYF